MKHRESGFTIPELLIAIILSAFFSMLLLFFFFQYWRYGYELQADEDTLTTRLDAGDLLREELGTATNTISQNGIADPNPLVPDTSIASNQYWTPIHAIPGTTNMPAAGSYTPLLYFRRYSVNSAGQYIMNGTEPYHDEYVLYLDGSTKSLMQRTIANPNAAGDKLLTSCPAAFVSSTCPADKTIGTDIASVATRYFSRTGNVIDYTSIWDPDINSYVGPDFPAVEVVELTLNLTKKTTFQTSTNILNSTIIRVALRNYE
jgi:type II secretory pathway pseudopilin PulG